MILAIVWHLYLKAQGYVVTLFYKKTNLWLAIHMQFMIQLATIVYNVILLAATSSSYSTRSGKLSLSTLVVST